MMLKRTSFALALAGFILAAAAALRYAQGLEIISADATRRTMQVMIGLILAAYANVMPKDIGRWRSARAAATSQSAMRVGGWSLTLAGLAYAGLWAFTPIAFADVAATGVVAVATLVTAGYCAWSFFICRRTQSGPALERHI
jgi:Ca2+/Na+ antiporter